MEYFAIDLGGTWIRSAVVSADGSLTARRRRPTGRQRPAEEILRDLSEEIGRACSRGRLAGVGIGIATAIDADGRAEPSDNLPTLTGVNLAGVLGERAGLPVSVGNDANCFALGEWDRGADRACGVLVGLTLGTGLGMGIIVDGAILRGRQSRAGEIWNCPADLTGEMETPPTIESLISGTGIEETYRKRTGLAIAGADIAKRARQGDADAARVFNQFGRALGRLIHLLCGTLDPDAIVLGGSVTAASGLFRPAMDEALETVDIRVRVSDLGERAALFGAAAIARALAGQR